MSIRHTKNATTKQTKRNSGTGGIEIVAVAKPIQLANNTNITGADVTVGNEIVYRGHEHIPVGTAQYDVNAV